jgi:hypothetical protein
MLSFLHAPDIGPLMSLQGNETEKQDVAQTSHSASVPANVHILTSIDQQTVLFMPLLSLLDQRCSNSIWSIDTLYSKSFTTVRRTGTFYTVKM